MSSSCKELLIYKMFINVKTMICDYILELDLIICKNMSNNISIINGR